jgi:prolyl-tRNA synthetase
LYQIQTKYRDERRPRFGVMRSREFIMKDAYSFDINQQGLDESYKNMHDAYVKIFDRCGLDYKIVEADSGAIGGSNSQEFMVKSEVGEATIVYCSECGYAANIEKSECLFDNNASVEEERPIEKVHTPNVKTIEDLNKFFNEDRSKFVKTILYRADNKVVAVMVRGDREVNETKLINLLGCIDLQMADVESVKMATGAEVGFAGPVGLDVEVYVDREVSQMKNFIVGANETNYHFKNVNKGRDFKPKEVCDLRNITINDPCPKCKGKIEIAQGIEVGHIFKLGTKYSKTLNCTFLDENGKDQLMIMGCYGIGINRTIAAIIEQCNDGNGIIWPMSVAPYKVIVVPVMASDPVQLELAKKIYDELTSKGIDTILDDRDERAGVKFKDADLIGIPLRVTIGKKAGEGVVEFKQRDSSEVKEMRAEEVLENVIDIINKSIM